MIGAVLTGFALVQVSNPLSDYYCDVHVLFYTPQSTTDLNPAYATANRGAVDMASVVQLAVGHHSVAHTDSTTVSLLDEAVYDGAIVVLPNSGGQWTNKFDQPILDVQVSAHSVSLVKQRVSQLITEIQTVLVTRQQAAGVPANQQIRMSPSPLVADVIQGEGSRNRASIGVVILGVGLTLTIAILLDRRRRGPGAPALARPSLSASRDSGRSPRFGAAGPDVGESHA